MSKDNTCNFYVFWRRTPIFCEGFPIFDHSLPNTGCTIQKRNLNFCHTPWNICVILTISSFHKYFTRKRLLNGHWNPKLYNNHIDFRLNRLCEGPLSVSVANSKWKFRNFSATQNLSWNQFGKSRVLKRSLLWLF